MSIENRRQCENTRTRLQELEQLYETKRQAQDDDHIRELTLRSLKKRINQFKEEIARYEARAGTTTRRGWWTAKTGKVQLISWPASGAIGGPVRCRRLHRRADGRRTTRESHRGQRG